jgi:hypothetical protein
MALRPRGTNRGCCRLERHRKRRTAAAGSFDVLLTADRNLEHQQNLTTLPISVVVLVAPTNRIESLAPLVPELLELLKALPPRRLVRIGV